MVNNMTYENIERLATVYGLKVDGVLLAFAKRIEFHAINECIRLIDPHDTDTDIVKKLSDKSEEVYGELFQ
jgi:hypothetical protein